MPHKLSNRLCLAYSLPVMTSTWLIAPIGVLQGIYAKYYGLSLTTIASVLLLARLFDALSDPLVSYYVDRYYQRNGTYKPFIFSGGILFIVSSYFLYTPPVQVGAPYFTAWLLAFYFAWTLFEMPHLAWASELAQTSEAKTRIYSFRNMISYTGLLLFYTIPLLPMFETRAITPETLRVSVMIAVVLMLQFLIVCLKTRFTATHLPSRQSIQQSETQSTNHLTHIHTALKQQQNLYPFLLSVLNNKPLLIFISAFFMITIGSGMWYSLIFLYVDTYLDLGNQFAQMFLLAFALGAVATPVWYKLAVWWGKKATWILATLLLIVSFIYTGFLSPGETSFVALVTLKVIQTLGFTCMGALAPAILSEIIDFSHWKYDTKKNATYFAIYTFIQKTTLAIATALGFAIAGFYGFDATATTQNEQSIFGLTWAIAWLPAVFATLALVFILLSPINEHRHRVIRRRLDAKALRTAREIQQQSSLSKSESGGFIKPKHLFNTR